MRQISIRRYAYSGENPVAKTGVTYTSIILAANTRYLGLLTRWTLENTSPAEVMLVDHPAGLFLYTGRKGVASDPAENQARPTAFQTPGEFLTQRIVEDSVTVIGLSGLRAPIAGEIIMLRQRCPDALEFVGTGGRTGFPAFYRVAADDPCLRALAREFRVGER
jgi:hypothetical protein